MVQEKVIESQNEFKKKVSTEVKEDLAKSYRDALHAKGESEDKISTEQKFVERTTREVQGRMDRKNNVVLHGVPEEVITGMNLGERAEKIQHDKLVFIDMCEEMGITCYNGDIEEIRRIGRYQRREESGKPRPILISLRGHMKDRVMRNLYKLKNARSSIFQKVGVTHDMTKEERERDKELKEEAEKRNDAEKDSGNYYVIRGSPWNRYILKVKRRETHVMKKASGTSSELVQEVGGNKDI